MLWTIARVAGFASDAGFRGRPLAYATALAWATSEGDDTWAYVLDPGPITDQRGLWGIDVVAWPQEAVYDLSRPLVNAQRARALYLACDRSFDWSAVARSGIPPATLALGSSAAEHPSRVQSSGNALSQVIPPTLAARMTGLAERASSHLVGLFRTEG